MKVVSRYYGPARAVITFREAEGATDEELSAAAVEADGGLDNFGVSVRPPDPSTPGVRVVWIFTD